MWYTKLIRYLCRGCVPWFVCSKSFLRSSPYCPPPFLNAPLLLIPITDLLLYLWSSQLECSTMTAFSNIRLLVTMLEFITPLWLVTILEFITPLFESREVLSDWIRLCTARIDRRLYKMMGKWTSCQWSTFELRIRIACKICEWPPAIHCPLYIT